MGRLRAFACVSGLVISGLAGSSQAMPETLVEAIQRDWFAPRAAAFAQDSAALPPAVQALCDAVPEQSAAALENARRHWRLSVSSWERLSGVAFGPVLERRSQRAIDFTPTRPRMIEKALKAEPKTLVDMELIGTPAKGLPALEWLLWVKLVQPASPECRYAVRLADEIQREAEALAAAKLTFADDQAALIEVVNQWVGGLERLRWPSMEMPLRVALTSGINTVPDFPRRDSGAASLTWSAQWDGLHSLAMVGEGSLHAALRVRRHAKVADKLAAAALVVDAAMQGLNTGDNTENRERILAAARTLAGLKRLVETEVALALGVNIGFSDADGD